jgi:hypothetical protein
MTGAAEAATLGGLMNWVAIFNRLWPIINTPGVTYFGGPRFLDTLREVDVNVPPYAAFIAERNANRQSTSRKDYFFDLLMGLDEPRRGRLIELILQAVEAHAADAVEAIRANLGGPGHAPSAEVPDDIWSADRLNRYLAEIDASLGRAEYARAVTVAYSALEGFHAAFFRAKSPGVVVPKDLLVLSRFARDWLRANASGYPDEILNLLNPISNAVDRARNRFGDAHFEGEAGRWLAIYVRDLVNSQVRLLLHFI